MFDLLSLILDTSLLLIGIFFLITSIVFCFEVIFSYLSRSTTDVADNSDDEGTTLTSIILIPAHNEQDVIEATLSSLQPKLSRSDRILVIADNCTDKTARICRSLGTDVLERFNEELRGKSYALDYGRDSIRQNLPDVIFNIDADCDCSSLDLQQMKKVANTTNSPIQCYYEMYQSDTNSISSRLSAFAWWIRNHVRASGAKVLHIPCQLMGSGMAFPAHIFNKIDFSSNALAEDLQIGLELSYEGHHPIYLSSSKVTSFLPANDDTADTQKTRWIHGHISTILNVALPLFLKSLLRRNWRSMLQCANASFPPITLTIPLLLSLTLLSWVTSETFVITSIYITALLFVATGIFSAFLSSENSYLSTKDLFSIPILLLKKLYIPFTYFIKKEKTWVKTERDD